MFRTENLQDQTEATINLNHINQKLSDQSEDESEHRQLFRSDILLMTENENRWWSMHMAEIIVPHSILKNVEVRSNFAYPCDEFIDDDDDSRKPCIIIQLH